jgi:hypothetical protein
MCSSICLAAPNTTKDYEQQGIRHVVSSAHQLDRDIQPRMIDLFQPRSANV